MYDDAEDEFVTEKVAELVTNGFFDVSMDPDTEEFIFTMTPEAESIDPEAYKVFFEHNIEEVRDEIERLMDAGLVEVTGISEDGEALYSLTELGKLVQENGSL